MHVGLSAVGRESSLRWELLGREDELGLGKRGFLYILVNRFGRGGKLGIVSGELLKSSHLPALHAHAHAAGKAATESKNGEKTRCNHHHATTDEYSNEEVSAEDPLLVKGLARRADIVEVMLEAGGLEPEIVFRRKHLSKNIRVGRMTYKEA